jgi:hypothetical protein
MKASPILIALLCSLQFGAQPGFSADDQARLSELDAYWKEVSRSVREGDFDGYQATCHPSGVLVSGTSKSSYPLTDALARWKQGFQDTKAGKIKASVEFRFSQRYGDKTTAHETGIFLYSSTDTHGKPTLAYIHFEALLLKQGTWKIMMEYQKSKATQAEWAELK